MILTCPSCQSQYLIPDGSIGVEGRTVKCTNCGHKWHQDPIEDEVIHVDAEVFEPANTMQEPQEDEELERYYDPVAHHEARDDTSGLTVKAVAFTFFLCLALFVAIFTTGRQYFVQQWEPSAKFFEMIGLPVPVAGEGLSFDSVTATIEELDGAPVLIVQGRIDNESEQDVALPSLKIRSFSGNESVKDWVIPLGGKIMQSQQSIAFDYRLTDIPPENDKVTVMFAYQ